MVGQNYAWPVRGRFLIEVDGGSWVGGRHNTGAGFAKDLEKLNAAAELGYRVLRFTPQMINDGSALEQIRRILSSKEDNRDAA
jgi:very-short-patch-repair endonuclease